MGFKPQPHQAYRAQREDRQNTDRMFRPQTRHTPENLHPVPEHDLPFLPKKQPPFSLQDREPLSCPARPTRTRQSGIHPAPPRESQDTQYQKQQPAGGGKDIPSSPPLSPREAQNHHQPKKSKAQPITDPNTTARRPRTGTNPPTSIHFAKGHPLFPLPPDQPMPFSRTDHQR